MRHARPTSVLSQLLFPRPARIGGRTVLPMLAPDVRMAVPSMVGRILGIDLASQHSEAAGGEGIYGWR